MASERHLAMLLREGVNSWNAWRKDHPRIPMPDAIVADISGADLRGADLCGADLSQVDLSRANLNGADLSGANLREALLIGATIIGAKLITANLQEALLNQANLSGADFEGADLRRAYFRQTYLSETSLNQANLSGADFEGADLRGAKLIGAKLRGAVFYEADLRDADFSGADLRGADLSEAILVRTTLCRANLSDCIVYGITAWDVNLEGATQTNLRMTSLFVWEPAIIMVDNLAVAQLLNLLIHNQKTRDVFDTFTSKLVLILGRFGERNANLETLREALRNHPNGYRPVRYEVNPHTQTPGLDTVNILANLARFVVADLTDPTMVRSVLSSITAHAPTVPVQSLIEGDASLPSEYATWQTHRSFLPVYRYADVDQLIANLTKHVIEPAEGHVQARHNSEGHSS